MQFAHFYQIFDSAGGANDNLSPCLNHLNLLKFAGSSYDADWFNLGLIGNLERNFENLGGKFPSGRQNHSLWVISVRQNVLESGNQVTKGLSTSCFRDRNAVTTVQ